MTHSKACELAKRIAGLRQFISNPMGVKSALHVTKLPRNPIGILLIDIDIIAMA